ncbi:Protein transport protein yif1 OS=Schizosaccharomyces pombe (strain 972 / ATCC 24843) GN=hrf1 PE=3 SV=1 [Rhizoctonia solani AG-1 IB]|uniref:Protein YIF1 n=1 Tax=Thanatephorus cucumeris (strain AG1-IB / isolate 7/3/14) TaxID=1108050 RepID=A0A0B7FVA5_THACB|nr:Protein transport protein yif1 OS=Schizosaccharomyces pombe (strain 972 / ATCC 24843) GN=hrf1 PE=3 SV=1 [Rhizoctonia solani AG-1 IB]
MSYYPQPSTSYSPPPLQHPIPTHPPTAPPEPPATPESPSGYMRFTSNPASPGQQYAQTGAYNNPQFAQPQWQSFGAVPAGVGAVPVPGTQPMPPGQPNAMPGFSLPAAWGVNDATAQMGVQLGRSAVAAGQDYMEKNFGQHFLPLSTLKHQFNVSNHYVLKKLQLVLFPWRHKPWTRRLRRSDAQDTVGPPRYAPPREDLNSPDLYIPVMALVTYVLVAAVKAGLKGRFNPEVLGLTASKALAIVVVECAVVRLGCYFLSIQSTGQFIDLMAFGGYKFVGIIATLVASMLDSGNLLYWTVFVYCFLANAFFLLRSLRSVVLPDPSVSHSAPLTHGQRSLRVQFLFVLAMLQIVYMGVLVRV